MRPYNFRPEYEASDFCERRSFRSVSLVKLVFILVFSAVTFIGGTLLLSQELIRGLQTSIASLGCVRDEMSPGRHDESLGVQELLKDSKRQR
jgi:hypothetical protein